MATPGIPAKREKKFSDSEKNDLVDIICNDENVKEDGSVDEVILVKLRSKAIANKEKTAIYTTVSDQLADRGYGKRTHKSIKRMWNILFSDYIKAKEVLKTKSGIKALKSSPWVLTIADGMKRCCIEADLDEMVLDSTDLSVSFRYYKFYFNAYQKVYIENLRYGYLCNL